jgi:hypothetical protein
MSLTSDQRKQARYTIRRYLERSEAAKAKIHYSQARPITSLGDPPSAGFTTDCSGLVISAFYWADLWCAFPVKDPGGYHYSGWGYTGSLLETNKRRRVPLDHRLFIGDFALFGHWSRGVMITTHTTICRRGGNTMTSIWTSHGSELGPYGTRLQYRPDLLGVFRAESLA